MPLKSKKISWDDLPRYSPWVEILLNLKDFHRKNRTLAELHREYEVEKWGSYLRKASLSAFKVGAVDKWALRKGRVPLWDGESLVLDFQRKALRDQVEAIKNEILKGPQEAPIVELGCGYGTVLFKLKQDPRLKNREFWGLDYSPSALVLLHQLQKKDKNPIRTAPCNFFSKKMCGIKLNRRPIIFTSYALSTCVPRVSAHLIKEFLRLNPSRVIHFEPLYEDFHRPHLMDCLNRSYIERNDYNVDLLTRIEAFEKAKKLRILSHKARHLGMNPYYVASLLSWVPLKK